MTQFIKCPPEKPYYMMEAEAGKTYKICACGQSSDLPFCDGSHSGTGKSPFFYHAEETRNVSFCGCHKTQDPNGLCDGTHKTLG